MLSLAVLLLSAPPAGQLGIDQEVHGPAAASRRDRTNRAA